MTRSLIAITMGDPAGVGAEVTLKALGRLSPSERSGHLLIGSWPLWADAAHRFNIRFPLVKVPSPVEVFGLKRAVGVLDLGGPAQVTFGRVNAACGAAAVSYIRHAVRLAMVGEVKAVVTAPIHKEAVHRAGFKYPGHTEMLADWSGTKDYAMMMVGGPFRITLNSIHVSLQKAIRELTAPHLARKIALTYRTLRDGFGIRNPRIALPGLNPHAGEGGAFGNEEIRVVAPVVRRCRALGWNVTGPYPPDTLFQRVAHNEFDAVVALYHDQGLIPVKVLEPERAVNLTLGLPFIRTSPDHGTAFDIAGKGKADPSSTLEALHLAKQLSARQAHSQFPKKSK